MVEKYKSKRTNPFDPFNFDIPKDCSTPVISSITGWACEDKEPGSLCLPTTEKKENVPKASENSSKLTTKTEFNKKIVPVLGSMKTYTGTKSDNFIVPSNKMSHVASFLTKRTRRNIEIQHKIDLISQVKLEPSSISASTAQTQRKRPTSTAAWKHVKRIEGVPHADTSLLNNIKRSKNRTILLESEPSTERRSSSTIVKTANSKGKSRLVKLKVRLSPRLEPFPMSEHEGNIRADLPLESPRHHAPLVNKKKVPGGCFNAINNTSNTNTNFSRKTYMGISRIMGTSHKTSMIEGVTSQLVGESMLNIAPGQKEDHIQFSGTKLYLNRLLQRKETRDDSKGKLEYSPSVQRKASLGREHTNSECLRQQSMIQMPLGAKGTHGQNLIEKLKVKMKQNNFRPKGFLPAFRPRSKELSPLDELNVRALNYDSIINNTSLML